MEGKDTKGKHHSIDVSNALWTWKRSIILILIATLLICLYLRFAWKRYERIALSEATVLAQSLEVMMHSEHIEALSGGMEDLNSSDYITTKRSLERLTETTNPIRFAYLLGEREGNIVILMDSEPVESPHYSPPGQLYEEASSTIKEVLMSGSTVIEGPVSDRWGTWISALVPITDKGKTIAIFGIDYSAFEWYAGLMKRLIPDIVVSLSVLVMFVALLRIWVINHTLKQRSDALTFSEALYRSVFDQAPIGIAIGSDNNVLYGAPNNVPSANRTFETIVGRNREELSALSWMDITHPDDLETDVAQFQQFKKGNNRGYSLEKRYIRRDGSSIWVKMIIAPFIGGPKPETMHLCLLEDISQRKQAEDALKESERSKSVLISHLAGLAYRCNYDREWTMQFVSEGCYGLTGYRVESLLNNKELSFYDLIAPEYRELLWSEWERVLAKREPFKFEYEIVTAQGERKWVLEVGQGIYSENGGVEALEGIILDITDRKKIENELRYNHQHDRLTGLYNRNYLENLLMLDSKKRTAVKKAVVSINLSAMQSLTTTYGFHYMQDLMKKTADALRQHCTETRTLFNTYENRFVFYLKGYKDKSELLTFCANVASTVETLLTSERIHAGIGVMEIDRDNERDVDQLLKQLLIASESALSGDDKDDCICFYDEDMEAKVIRGEEIKRELVRIAEGEQPDGLFLQYQPILDLKSNQICGFEALARMRSNKLGLVSPMEFIPIAEMTKLIIPIGEMVIRKSFRFLNRLKAKGFGATHVSINVSVIQLLKKDFGSKLFEMIKEAQVQPENIGLEITESVFTSDNNSINKVLGELKDAGLHIAIDDFGTGYSSLARERELNINCLKIDKSFIDKLMAIGLEEAITSDVILMAHKLGHCTIAEGVEHDKQRKYLETFGCDKIQGYLISKPLDEDAAIEFLENQGNTLSIDCGCL